MADALFYLLSAATVVAAVGVVASRNPLFSVLSLLGSFFCLAVIYLLAGFQFLALTQLLVYAGAIMVLFLFVVMLLNLADPAEYAERPATLGRGKLAVAGATAGALLLVGVGAAAFGGDLLQGRAVQPTGESLDDLDLLATVLFSRYALPFEAASLLLLATMVAVVLLAKRQRASSTEPAGWPWQRGVEQ